MTHILAKVISASFNELERSLYSVLMLSMTLPPWLSSSNSSRQILSKNWV